MTMPDATLREYQHQDGVRAAIVWHQMALDRLRSRLETCRPEELGELQGQVRAHKGFLKIFGLGDGPPAHA